MGLMVRQVLRGNALAMSKAASARAALDQPGKRGTPSAACGQ